MSGPRRSRIPGLFLAAALGACRGGDPPAWIELARAEVRGEAPLGEVALAGGGRARFEQQESDLWLVTELERAHWTPGAAPGRFTAALPILAVGSARAGGSPYRLTAAERSFAYEPDLERFGEEPGRFATQVLALELALEPGAEPPERCELRAVVDYQTAEAGALRVRGRRQSGAGFWVPGGRPRTLELDLPPAHVLRFATVLEPLLGDRAARLEARTFRVRLDGATLFEESQAPDVLGESCRWHALALPRGGVQRARLSFEVEGPLALSAFLAPVLAPGLAPGERGAYGARPWAEQRPDIVVFLADTFRADNLAAYGATTGLTPQLDAFAGRSRVFARAWSTSTHTLPAHSTLFSGVYPHQNGQVDLTNPLPGAVETLAERLAARGYRCGAVTDGVMVSRSHGLDQGFESFDERREAGTLERVRAFLDADDGRPVFLFVQSYAVHSPYLPRPETCARLGGKLALDRDFESVQAGLAGQAANPPPEVAPTDPAVQEAARRLRDLYLATVADLDALFGLFLDELDARGLLARGTLVFTSDHGEAFFEHGRPFHTNKVYEEELRVPLIVHGQRFAPGREERPVSLIDFAPTVAELAGLARPAHWEGRSWLAPPASRRIYAFQSRRVAPPSTLAVIDGARKLIGFEQKEELRAGRIYAAFDLASDPLERHDLRQHAAWPAQLEREQRAELERLLKPLVTPETSQLTGDELHRMQELGYGGQAK